MIDFIYQLFTTDSAAHTALIFFLIIALGLALGGVRLFGISLGSAGVLFAGILFGHFKIVMNHDVMEFVREFGLILFVYTIGMQVGPGFVDSLKKEGVRLNIIAFLIVMTGALVVIVLSRLFSIPMAAALGIFSGACTNTPSLAAIQQAMKDIPSITPEMLKLPGLSYAVCYPFGILGTILTMILFRHLFRIDPTDEAERYRLAHTQSGKQIVITDFVVENPKLEGVALERVPLPSGVVISRVVHSASSDQAQMEVALPKTVIRLGDKVRAVGPSDSMESLKLLIGGHTTIDLRGTGGRIITSHAIVTKKDIIGKTLSELSADEYGVAITRIHRGEVVLAASPEVELRFADSLTVVGEKEGVEKFLWLVGNSTKDVDHPQLIPVFVGLALGVLVGSWPIHIPGMSTPIRLGLAGGPLIVAILLSRVGRIGHMVWYMPSGTNFILREIGITLFLACVGLRCGDQFAASFASGNGWVWMGIGAAVTMIPLIIGMLYARWVHRTNFLAACGIMSGSMTSPSSLSFANQMAPSSAQSVSYATIYPLVLILRVIVVQVLVTFFIR